MSPESLIACASPPISGNGNPGRVPGRRGSSRIVPSLQTNGCACPSAATLVPTIWPALLNARGVVEFPPSVPRSMTSLPIDADAAGGVVRRCSTAEGSVQLVIDATAATRKARRFMGTAPRGRRASLLGGKSGAAVRFPCTATALSQRCYASVHRGDQTGGALVEEIVPRPVEQHEQLVAESDQLNNVHHQPHHPGREAGEREAAD